MKFSFREFLMMKTFVDQARQKNERKEVNPEYNKPRIWPIVIGWLACSFLSGIATFFELKTLVVLTNVVGIGLSILFIRALIKRLSKR